MSPRLHAARVWVWALTPLPLLSLPPGSAHGAWIPNGTRIPGAGYPLRAIPDDAGGAYVAWDRGLPRVARLTGEGEVAPGWAQDWNLPWGAGSPRLVPDQLGGIFVLFDIYFCQAHCAGELTDLRMLHVGVNGVVRADWPRDGVRLGANWGFDFDNYFRLTGRHTVAISDGRGGVFAAWSQALVLRTSDLHELRIQRADSSGALLWGDNGALIRSYTVQPCGQAIVADGKGGAFIFWQDERPPGLFAQYVSPSGEPLWATDGIPVPREAFHLSAAPLAVSDGAHGVIVLWSGESGSGSGIYAARVTKKGRLPWHGDAQVLSTSSPPIDVRTIPTRDGGAVVAWRDIPGTREKLFAQSLNHAGKVLWKKNGVPVCTAPGPRALHCLATDGHGGAYIAWRDTRAGDAVYALRLDRFGKLAKGWDLDGSPVRASIPNPVQVSGYSDVFSVEMTSDEAGGAVVVWADIRESTCRGCGPVLGYAMKLAPDGPVASPPLTALMTVDVPPAQLPTSSFALAGLRPNPGPQGSLLRFSLRDASPARIELFDLAGRRVWMREVGGLGPGDHEMRLGEGTWLSPGVYLARLTQKGLAATRRVAIIQ